MESRSAGLRQYYVGVGTVDAKLTTLVELLQALRVDARLALAVACSSRDTVDAVVHALACCNGFNIAVLLLSFLTNVMQHSDLEMYEVEQQLMQIKRRLQPAAAAAAIQQHTEGAVQAAGESTALPPHQQQQQQHDQPLQQLNQQPPQQLVPATAGQHNAGQAAAALQTTQQQPQAPTVNSSSPSPSVAASVSWTDSRSLVLVTTDVCLKAIPRELLPIGMPLLIQYDLPANKDVLQRRVAAVFGSSKERSRRAGKQVVIDFVAAGEVAAFRARERLSAAPVLDMPVHVPDIFL